MYEGEAWEREALENGADPTLIALRRRLLVQVQQEIQDLVVAADDLQRLDEHGLRYEYEDHDDCLLLKPRERFNDAAKRAKSTHEQVHLLLHEEARRERLRQREADR